LIMRRAERQISKEEALIILAKAEFGVMSSISDKGSVYGVPLSFCVIENDIYFHCAVEGRKLNNMEYNSKVSFCVVGKTEVLPARFSTKFESVIVAGRSSEVFSDEKLKALEGLILKYSPEFHQSGLEYISNQDARTRVFKISIDSISGKARR
jgi:uncharacterized protein